MTRATSLAAALIAAIDEPALVIRDQLVELANPAARQLLGSGIEGKDIRLAIRQPQALDAIVEGSPVDLEVGGIGDLQRRWKMTLRPLDGQSMLLRLSDLSSLRATEKMRVDFVANASHELRTPLATILGYAETLAESDDIPEPLRTSFATSIHVEARRMLTLIEDLMSLSRIEADRFLAPDGAVDPHELIRRTAAQARPLAERHGVTINTDVAPGLSPIVGDAIQLSQMLDNLIANAIRYGCGEPGDRVDVAASTDRDRLVITVIDHGPGIDPELVPRLTERFYRVDNARSRGTGGTGLGLSIVKQIVERHRGLLSIASAPGQGMAVSVRLPLVAEH